MIYNRVTILCKKLYNHLIDRKVSMQPILNLFPSLPISQVIQNPIPNPKIQIFLIPLENKAV